jgi:ankyrin repeat protein
VFADGASLLDAAQSNDIDSAMMSIDQGVGVNTTSPDGATALHWAAHWGATDLAERLLSAGALVDASNELGITPISIACRNGSEAMVDLLLKAKADAKGSEPSGETVLMSCARTGSLGAVEQLLAAGAEPNSAEVDSGQTALMWATAGGHWEIVDLLIGAGADVNASSSGKFTPLMFAARTGDLKSAELLLDAGAEVNVATEDGLSPLLIASASLDAITGSDYRLVIEESQHESLGALLLDRGADVTQSDQYGMTALHYAVEMNKPSLLRALLKRDADPNAQLTQGLPFRRGDYVGREAYDGASPFWLAARLGNVEMMRELLDAGADPELRQAWGVTPTMVAAGVTQTDSRIANEEKLIQALELLVLEIKTDIHSVDRSGQTAVHGAANVSGNEIIKFLVAEGADPEAVDSRGRTPHDVAMRTLRPRPITAALLRELAAN